MFKVGDKVSFGRPNGEQTVALVEKVNKKSLNLRTLEARGIRSQAGESWRVSPSLCTIVERGGKPVEPGPFKDEGDNLVSRALSKLNAQEIRALSVYFRRGYKKI